MLIWELEDSHKAKPKQTARKGYRLSTIFKFRGAYTKKESA